MTRNLKIVAQQKTTGSDGKPVDALPIRLWQDGEVDERGIPVDPQPYVVTADGQPAMWYTTKTIALNGVQVATIPVGERAADSQALIDWDFSEGNFRFNGQNYQDEAAALVAIGGSKVGATRTIGPYVVGAQIAADPGFASGVDGFAGAPSFPEGSVAQVSSRLRTTATGLNGANTFRSSKSFTSVRGRAYRWQMDYVARQDANVGSLSVNAANSADMFGSASLLGDATTPATLSCVVAAQSTTTWVGTVQTTNLAFSSWVDWDNQDLREVYPYQGFVPGSLSFEHEDTTPASPGAGKVMLEWGADRASERVRLLWDNTNHIRLVVTESNAEQANLDLGAVAPLTKFRVKAAITGNRASASLDGYTPASSDTSVLFPGLGKLWIGRSQSGETWDGVVRRLKVWPTALSNDDLVDPNLAFMAYGDSTATAGVWRSVLAAGYNPDRYQINSSAGGENSGQMLARVQAASDTQKKYVTLFRDLANTGEIFDYWMQNFKECVRLLKTDRWVLVPPCQNSQGYGPLNGYAVVDAIQKAMYTDPFFAGHVPTEAATRDFLQAAQSDSSRTDGTHFQDAFETSVTAPMVRAVLDARGW